MVSFVHGGNIGDVVWSIPTIRHLADDAILYLRTNVRAAYHANVKHPCGVYQMTTPFAEALIPLIAAQPGMRASIWQGEPIDYDLDLFRKTGFDLGRGHLGRAYSYAFVSQPRLWEPWLFVDTEYHGNIVVNRTARYRHPRIDYRFLNGKGVWFVGLESEYQDFQKVVPDAVWKPTVNILDLARIIKGCRFFVGNQSVSWAIAEGLGVHRCLEICPRVPNCSPQSPKGWEAWTQEHLEQMVSRLEVSTAPHPPLSVS